MNPQKQISRALLTICALGAASLISACSNGFSTGAAGLASKGTDNGSLSGGNGSIPPVVGDSPPGDISPVEKMDYKALISSDQKAVDNRFEGMNIIQFDKENKEVVFSIPLYFEAEMQADLSVAFAKYPDIRISMTTLLDEEGFILGNALEIRLPIKSLIKGLESIPGRLPSGEPLKGFPKNEAPTTNVAFNIKGKQNMKLHLYLGVNNIGFFIEGDWAGDVLGQVPLSIYIPSKNEANTAIRGYFGFVAKSSKSRPGFYLSYKLPPEISQFLETKLGIN
ncbi:MAG: hypothetical protein ACK5P5_05375 [Pseudobdellovibrionaceae bacterium]